MTELKGCETCRSDENRQLVFRQLYTLCGGLGSAKTRCSNCGQFWHVTIYADPTDQGVIVRFKPEDSTS